MNHRCGQLFRSGDASLLRSLGVVRPRRLHGVEHDGPVGRALALPRQHALLRRLGPDAGGGGGGKVW